jgi:hypothetical protein
MKRSRFSEEQITYALRQADSGTPTAAPRQRHPDSGTPTAAPR